MTAILFDMDGVLVDSGPAHHESWRRLAQRHGIEISEERFKQSFGRPSRDIIRTLWGEGLTAEQIPAHDTAKEQLYRALIAGRVPLMAGARDTLSRLRDAGFALAVATSGPPENLDLVLREGRLTEFFQATVHGFDIRHGKPAPDCFLLAAQRLRMQPAECVVIEDAPIGIEAGAAAGMPVIALAGTHDPDRLSAAGAQRVISELSQLSPTLVTEVLSHAGGPSS